MEGFIRPPIKNGELRLVKIKCSRNHILERLKDELKDENEPWFMKFPIINNYYKRKLDQQVLDIEKEINNIPPDCIIDIVIEKK